MCLPSSQAQRGFMNTLGPRSRVGIITREHSEGSKLLLWHTWNSCCIYIWCRQCRYRRASPQQRCRLPESDFQSRTLEWITILSQDPKKSTHFGVCCNSLSGWKNFSLYTDDLPKYYWHLMCTFHRKKCFRSTLCLRGDSSDRKLYPRRVSGRRVGHISHTESALYLDFVRRTRKL